jgi:hypothetical protein
MPFFGRPAPALTPPWLLRKCAGIVIRVKINFAFNVIDDQIYNIKNLGHSVFVDKEKIKNNAERNPFLFLFFPSPFPPPSFPLS